MKHLAGRLLGVRIGELRSVADWRSLSASFLSVADEIRGMIVICADYRGVQVMHDEVARALLADYKGFNLRVYRSALLLPRSAPTLRLQMERLLREARNFRRRICADAEEVNAWLASCLDKSEQARLDEFLSGSDKQK